MGVYNVHPFSVVSEFSQLSRLASDCIALSILLWTKGYRTLRFKWTFEYLFSSLSLNLVSRW